MKTPMQELIERLASSVKMAENQGENMELVSWGMQDGMLISYNDAKLILHEYASQASTVDDESAKEPIQSALYATNKFTVDDCSVLSEGILQYIKDAGYSITSNEYASQGAEAVGGIIDAGIRALLDKIILKVVNEEVYFHPSISSLELNKILASYNQPSSRHQQNSSPAPDGWVRVFESELKEVIKLQDFASQHGDAQGYARLCGQQVLLERLIKKSLTT